MVSGPGGATVESCAGWSGGQPAQVAGRANVIPPDYNSVIRALAGRGGFAVTVTDDTRVASNAPGPGGFDRTPPQDIAAEQCVLGAMILSKDAIADVVEVL